MIKVTCSPVDALPSGPSSKFRRFSCAISHAGEKCNPIIGTLHYSEDKAPSEDHCCIESTCIWTADNMY